jgi:hypothetical protein
MCRHVRNEQDYCYSWCAPSLKFLIPVTKRILSRRRPVDILCLTGEDSDLVCQPGVGWMEINETLKEKGIPLFFPVRAER